MRGKTSTRSLILAFYIASLLMLSVNSLAQTPTPTAQSALRYIDQVSGMTAGDAVQRALEYNGEILALRSERDAARSLIRQARLRANPKVTASGAKQIGGPDNNQMAEVMLPLELGGRRAARVAVAQRELEVREFALENQERILAAEVRLKFGEALAAIRKLQIAEETLAVARKGYELIVARVADGKTAPLEQNILLVEVNRLHAMRETAEARVEAAMFELRNMLGMRPEEPLRLRGSLDDLLLPLRSLTASIQDAVDRRPDLEGARAMARLASARVEQARSEGRLDAGVTAGYQRMNSGFMLNGIDDNGALRPIQEVFRFFTFGVEIDLPIRNRNQGAIAAAQLDREASERRADFGELTIRREVAVALARYERAFRSLSIFKNGVRDQANANLQVVWQTYELGSRSLLDYIGEQRRFLEVENELIDAQLEAYNADVEIMRATNAPELRTR